MAANEKTLHFEEEHGINVPWTPNSHEYQDALILMAERQYHRALYSLELLVVQQLFELSKLSMSGIGMSSHFIQERL